MSKTVALRCLCGRLMVAYVWSLYGCGKRCPKCGTVMGSLGFIRLANGLTMRDIAHLYPE